MTETPIDLLLEAGPSDSGRGMKARRGKTSQPRLVRFGKREQSSQRGSAPRQAPSQARWDGEAAPITAKEGPNHIAWVSLHPTRSSQTSCYLQRGWWRPLMASAVWGGRTGLASSPMAARRERWLKWHLQEAKEKRRWPKRSGSNCPTFRWAPSPLSARWKDPRGWEMGTARVPEVPLGWLPSPDAELASPCFGL